MQPYQFVATLILAPLFFAGCEKSQENTGVGESKPPEAPIHTRHEQTTSKPRTQPIDKDESDGFLVYRLDAVTIPPDSPFRKETRLNDPPTVYVKVFKNSKQIGETSDEEKGWLVVFLRNKQHYYRIDLDSDAEYGLEIWDDQWGDVLILSITGLSYKSFASPILEKLGIYTPPELATTVKFTQIE